MRIAPPAAVQGSPSQLTMTRSASLTSMPAIMPSTDPALRHRSRVTPRHSIGGPVATGSTTISPSGPGGTGERAAGRIPKPMQPATAPAAISATMTIATE